MIHPEEGHESCEQLVLQTLQTAGVKLICIDFDATFISIHTGGLWTQSAQALSVHVRPLFLTLVPMLVVEANLQVAIVTFSPQLELVWEVLRLCFHHTIAQKLIVRCDDTSWTPVPLTDRMLVEFGPESQICGMHVDRKYKLPYVISAAVQASQVRGQLIRNRETVLIDDDAATIRIAIDNGITGVYFDPECADTETLCKQIQKLHEPHGLSPPSPASQINTPCKRTQVRHLSTPETRRLSFTDSAQKTPPIARMPRKKKVNLCTPSPIMKFKSTVDMGRPKSKRATRKIDSDLHELRFMHSLTCGSTRPVSPCNDIGFLLQPSFKVSPAQLRDSPKPNRLLGSMFSLQEIDFDDGL